MVLALSSKGCTGVQKKEKYKLTKEQLRGVFNKFNLCSVI